MRLDRLSEQEAHISKQEELIDQRLRKGRVDDAADMLFDLIVRCADEHRFEKAEKLREKLFEFDPIALNKIVESAEIIERKKRQAMDKDHMDTWSELYNTLTVEEANALYYSMTHQSLGAETPILKNGEANARLYFINQGECKMIHDYGDKEVLLKILGAGDIVGDDTFFQISDCTTTVVALTPVELNFLERDRLLEWKDEFPRIESKLIDYCGKMETTQDLLEKINLDRRYHRRVSVSNRVVIQPLDASGEPQGRSFKGDLADISIGGVSVYIYRSNKEMARRLLGRRFSLELTSLSEASEFDIKQNGLVTGVSDRFFGDYSIHLKFDQTLDPKILEALEPFDPTVLKP
jgi:CRP-like cAMP-binding protein